MIHEQRQANGTWQLLSGFTTRAGQRLFIRGQTVQKLSFPLKKKGTPTGDVTFTVRKIDDTVILSKVACDAAELTTELIWYEAIFDTAEFIDEEVRVLVEYGGGNILNFVSVGYYSGGIIADEKLSLYTAGWADIAGDDITYSYTYEPCIFVAASSDDCAKDSLAPWFDITSVAFYAGYYGYHGTYKTLGSAARFLNVPIPPGATILEARLRLIASDSVSNTVVNTRLRCQKAIEPMTFSTEVDFDARTWTTAYVNWDAIGAWTQDEIYISPDFAIPLQEVVDQPGYQVGDAIAVLWDDFEQRSTQSNGRYRVAYSFDDDPDKAPQLYVRFEIPPPSYRVYIDWEDDTLNSLYGNITKDVKGASWEIGKNQELGHADAGTGELVLNNTDLKYAPWYGASPLYDYVKPGKMVTITAFHDGIGCPLYRGRINNIVPHLDPAMQDVYIYLVDDMAILATTRISTALYTDTRTGVLINAILDAVGWDADMREISVGSIVIDYFWCDEEFALDRIHALEDIEGGMFYIDHRGYAVWEDRFLRYKPPHVFSQYTLTSVANLDYNYNLTNVRNRARGTFQRKATWTDEWVILDSWGIQPDYMRERQHWHGYTACARAGIMLSPGAFDFVWETPDFFVDYTFHCTNMIGVDMTGTLSIVESNIGKRFYISGTNPESYYLIVWMWVQGHILIDGVKQEIEVEDATSQNAYGIRDYYISSPFSTSKAKLKSLVVRVLARNKDVRITDMPVTLTNATDELWDQILDRHVSDKITLTLATYGIDDTYFINKEIHTLTKGYVHQVTWILEKVAPEYYWVLGMSQLGIGTRLAP